MQGDDPPFLPVGTDVSAKYKGAFCEAKIKKVVRNIKCKVTLKTGGGTIIVNDDVIKGTLRVGSNVEVKQDPKKDAMEAVITKIQDCSQYTVVFDDGDITTLRRSALCLKSGRHFNESETLDQLPLTHPEHFSTPVIAGRRGRRGRAQSDDSEGEASTRPAKADSAEREPHVGRVVLVEASSGAERRRPQQPAFPALVVAPTPQIKVKEDYLVRSFKDGRYYTVPKKEAREFRKGSAPIEWAGVDAALQYLNNGVLPPHWDRDALFNESKNTSDDSSDDEPREEKDHFVAQLYKFMDDRGTPLNRNPTIANKDIDLYRLFRVVQKLGGYNRVTNQNQWKTIAGKMGFHPVTTSITNLCKQAYKKFLHSFEDFYRKLGVTLVAHPRGARTPPAGRSLIRDRDKQPPTSSSASSTPTSTPSQRGIREKDSDKSETEKSEKEEKVEKPEKIEKVEKPKEKTPRGSDEEDSADNVPLAGPTTKLVVEKKEEKEKPVEEKPTIKPRSLSKTRSLPAIKTEPHDKRTPKPRRPLSSLKCEKGDGPIPTTSRMSRRPHVSTDSDSSGRASRCGLTKKMQSRRSQSANSASSGNTIASNSSKRIRKRKSTDIANQIRCGITKKMQSRRSQSANSASSGNTIASNSSKRMRKRKSTETSTSEVARTNNGAAKAQVGDKLKVYYGPTQSESKVTYEAKVIEISSEGMLRVHYTGWNTRYDEWIKPQRIAINVTQLEHKHSKKGSNGTRRVRAKRTEESSARSDSDSDTDSEEDVKQPPKKSEDKPPSSVKSPPRPKDSKSSDGSNSSTKPRKRALRMTPNSSVVSPAKKLRTTSSSHQGRDYDLNEIRSELKGLHTVKQEPEEAIKQEVQEKEDPSPPETNEPLKPEKQPEDVYEFKEPEPFELELHDEKKKRTHRIFDDISPSKYTSTLSKSLSEEISEDPLRSRPVLRSPSLSPFRDYSVQDTPVPQILEEDSKDDLFSMDDDSFPDGSCGPIFEGFTPAKNQETYSKKNKISKLRESIEDSPESPADDEQSSDDEPEDAPIKDEPKNLNSLQELASSPVKEIVEAPKSPEAMKEASTEAEIKFEVLMPIEVTPKKIHPPKTPPQQTPIEVEIKEKPKPEEPIKLNEIPLPPKSASPPIPLQEPSLELPKVDSEPKEENPISEPNPKSPVMPASPLVDTEEDKSEPDSPARIDVLPEPPPSFLLHSEGPKIAEKLLKAINSAKRLSLSPPRPIEEHPKTPENDLLKPTESEEKLSSVPDKPTSPYTEPTKNKTELFKKDVKKTPEAVETIFGEPSKFADIKRDISDIKKVKPKDPSPSSLQNPLNILERRKSIADLSLTGAGKNNKVLSDTIQKLSCQINQSATNIPLTPFPSADRSDSSDSDDSDRRLIIDKISTETWASGARCEPARASVLARSSAHAGKSPGEWSAGESLLMLEDACKNERKHSASVVVAGGGPSRALASVPPPSMLAEEDSNISLLLCEETIPGSPAPDSEPTPQRHRLHMPFASATRGARETEAEGGASSGAGGGRSAGEGWTRRHALLDNTPPTTPDSSDLEPHRDRRMSERDSPVERKDDEDDNRTHDGCSALDHDKPHAAGRSRKASESSAAGTRRGRRRRDTDEPAAPPPPPPLKYNFYVDLDPSWDCQRRISVLTSRLSELRKAYHSVKAELAAIDRRRKKLRRKEREAVKAAKAACS